MNDRATLVHLAGYATIASILATANWAGLSAVLLALPLVLGTLWVAGQQGARSAVDRAKADIDHPIPSPATDGGTDQPTTGSDRNRPENE
ncbi:hypothetical protein EGH21_12660 [Halomicroarcula sp. F13]|uniref:Uncharacterized protein n=1 Tax=Haloarcula rubra TaxID=2487747 RepID=A0AAW4PRW7_9EURY|nr:hypothetical protein [Halomicroarcula rubra]MBX0323882.1 hypothetical protein [Halomicroarcula rubra]